MTCTIVIPFYSGDQDAAQMLIGACRAQVGDFEIAPLFCADDGCCDEWQFAVRPMLGPYTTSQLFQGVVMRLGLGGVFLWLEPDCVLLAGDALAHVIAAFEDAHKGSARLAMMGRERSIPGRRLFYAGGAAIYRVTRELQEAVHRIRTGEEHDVALGRQLVGTPAAAPTKLIEDIVGWEHRHDLEHVRYALLGGKVLDERKTSVVRGVDKVNAERRDVKVEAKGTKVERVLSEPESPDVLLELFPEAAIVHGLKDPGLVRMITGGGVA